MEWLNYHHLYYFWVVCKEGGFSKASIKLRIAQSAVSLQVSKLEESLGKTLLLRSTSKKMTLTEEGQIVFGKAEEIFRQGQELVSSLRGDLLQNTLRIGALGSLSKNLQLQLLRPVLDHSLFGVTIDIGDAEALLKRLLTFQIDALLCDVPYAHAENENLLQREIAKEKICLIGRKSRERFSSLKERLENKGLYLPARSNPITSEIELYLSSQKIRAPIRGYIDDIALLRLLSLETEACVAIPRIGALRDLKSKDLFVQHEFKSLYQNFYLVLRRGGDRSRKILDLLGQK